MNREKPETAAAQNAMLTGNEPPMINVQQCLACGQSHVVVGLFTQTHDAPCRRADCGWYCCPEKAETVSVHAAECPITAVEEAHPKMSFYWKKRRRAVLEALLKGELAKDIARANDLSEAMINVYRRELVRLGALEGRLTPYERERAAKDAAYTERNRLVALLAALFPSSLEENRDGSPEDRAEGWNWVCYVDLPTGSATWHIPDRELSLFDHVPRHQGRQWDGHTTEEKYARIERLVAEWASFGGVSALELGALLMAFQLQVEPMWQEAWVLLSDFEAVRSQSLAKRLRWAIDRNEVHLWLEPGAGRQGAESEEVDEDS